MFSQTELLNECNIDERTREALLKEIRRRLTPPPIKVRADVEVSCYTYEGIEAIRAALRRGLEIGNSGLVPTPLLHAGPDASRLLSGIVNINLIAPPLYVITTQTQDREGGIARLEKVSSLFCRFAFLSKLGSVETFSFANSF